MEQRAVWNSFPWYLGVLLPVAVKDNIGVRTRWLAVTRLNIQIEELNRIKADFRYLFPSKHVVSNSAAETVHLGVLSVCPQRSGNPRRLTARTLQHMVFPESQHGSLCCLKRCTGNGACLVFSSAEVK